MIRSALAISLLVCFYASSSAQTGDTSVISISKFKLYPGTFSWREGGSFHDMTNWNSDAYTQGHLKQLSGSSWQFRMNYRLLFPQSYNDDYEKGYPLLIMFHGAGERANCWETNCYCTDCNPNQPEPGKAKAPYLNNDHMLVHGGQPFMNAVNLAGSKKADDQSLDPKAFPGFVLFPQMENTWGNAESSYSAVSFALRILRLVIKEHNVNPDRVYVAGLSMGGQAVLKALSMADWLFAAGIAMSPVPYTQGFDYEGAVTVPLWIFQGGLDQYPKPAHTEDLINRFREVGGSVRYTFYPEAGHNTWSRAFREPEFFSWLLQRRKNDIFRYFDSDYICATSDDGLPLSLPQGFPAYQWEKDGKALPASESTLVVKEAGTYRGRFSRVSNPGDKDWTPWSEPVALTASAPAAAKIMQKGTTYLPDLNGNNEAVLFTNDSHPYYFWERDNRETSLPDSGLVTIKQENGTYSLRVADYNGCKSTPSALVNVFFSNQAPVINEMKPGSLTTTAMSSSSVFLSWDDPSGLEKGYEIWRKNTSVNNSKWEMATLTDRNITFYYDTMLIPGSVYHYKIRAISSTGRSGYFPSDDLSDNVVVALSSENDTPLPPQNVRADLVDINTVRISWSPGRDESGIREYIISFGEQIINTGSADTTFTVTVEPNKQYAVTVSTADISGNISPPGNQYMVSTRMTGLFYKHSTGAWNSLADPSIQDTWNSPERTGHVNNLTLTPRVQEEYFNFEFNGFLYISTPGAYTFYLNSDDGSQFFVDGNMIIDFDGFHGVCNGGPESTTCPNGWGRPGDPVELSAGRHLIRIRFFQYTGGKNLFLRYRGPDTGGTTVLVPDAVLSSGAGPGSASPAAPGSLTGTATGMREVRLQWSASPTAGAEYEIYRSANAAGPFEIINRVDGVEFVDRNLIPGRTYHYRLRAVTVTGLSSYTPVVGVKTNNDNEKPSRPESLIVESGNFTRTILRWNPSSDNVGLAGYEIWAGGVRIGYSKVPAFNFADMEQGRVYEFYVVAVDLTGNRSDASERVNNELFVTHAETEGFAGFSFSVFPNPSPYSDLTIQIRSATSSAASITISDMMKRNVIRTEVEIDPGEVEFGMPAGNFLPDGLYIIDVRQGENTFRKKIIIANH